MARFDRRMIRGAVVTGALVAVMALAGCGRYGPLEAPPGVASTTATPEAGNKPPPDPGITKPDRPFVLDPLL